MPVTPLHVGLGAALPAAAPTRMSFMAFCTANVLIDQESAYNLWYGHYPVHAFLHTYVGASCIVGATMGLFLWLRWLASRHRLPNLFAWQTLSARQVATGAALGAYSHIVFDSVMHEDIRPLAPFSQTNTLFDAIPLGYLHLLCVALGAVGLVVMGWRAVRAQRPQLLLQTQ